MPRYSRERVWTVFVLALALCALLTYIRHQTQRSGDSDPLTNITRKFLFSPVLRVSNAVGEWWGNDVASVFRGPTLARDNRRLRSKIANLMQENRSLADEAAENIQLRALLDFKAHDPARLLPAEVLALKPFSDRDSAIFSRGLDDSVKLKQPALDEDGDLIGQVTGETSNTCDVMLLTDTLSSVGALVVSTQPVTAQPPSPTSSAITAPAAITTGATAATVTTATPVVAVPVAVTPPPPPAQPAGPAAVGICFGDHSDKLQLTDLPPDANVEVGDTVVTSGLGGVYPKDIPIGRIVAVNFDKTRYLKSAVVAPWADFNHIQEGFLLR